MLRLLLAVISVTGVLDQLFEEHIEYSELTPQLVERSIEIYIETFDPSKTLLLVDEVEDAMHLAPGAVQRIQSGDLSDYERVNEIIQRAVMREWTWRSTLLNEYYDGPLPPFKRWAKNLDQLRERQLAQIARFLHKGSMFEYRERLNAHEEPYLDEKQLPLLVVKALARAMDPHTAYFAPQESGEPEETAIQVSYDPPIGVIRLDSFYDGSAADLRRAIAELREEGPLDGLFLDLRRNRGGLLEEAVATGGLFVSDGLIAVAKTGDGAILHFRDEDGQADFDGALVILVSRITASAAEVVAQALQDWGVALVVGDERTYGKGTIQLLEERMQVTVGCYYTPSGRSPQLNGVKSDITLPSRVPEEVGEKNLRYPVTCAPIDIQEKMSSRWILYIPTLRARSEGRPLRGPDPQLAEAINITKDMILLESKRPTQ